MGNSNSGAARFGQICVQTDKSTYIGGETVTGRIYLNLLIPFPGNQLFLKLKGREFTQVVQTINESVTDNSTNPPSTKTVERHNYYFDTHSIIKMNVPIYTWSNLMPGQYTIPFAFMLPSYLPSSFHQQGNRYVANISYQLEGILEPALKQDFKLKYKQPFVVRQPISNAATGQVSEVSTQISACCSSKGSNVLRVNFEKNFYTPGETAQVYMQLDNSLASTACSSIQLALKQRLILSAGSYTETKWFTKVSRDLAGVSAGDKSAGNYIAVNLPAFEGRDYRDIERKNGITDILIRQSEDNSKLNPGTKGKLIKSEYFLEVSCPMDGCCATVPATSLPVEIYYPEIRLPVIPQPANWAPIMMPSINITLSATGGAPTITQDNSKSNYNPNMYNNTMSGFNPNNGFNNDNNGFGGGSNNNAMGGFNPNNGFSNDNNGFGGGSNNNAMGGFNPNNGFSNDNNGFGGSNNNNDMQGFNPNNGFSNDNNGFGGSNNNNNDMQGFNPNNGFGNNNAGYQPPAQFNSGF